MTARNIIAELKEVIASKEPQIYMNLISFSTGRSAFIAVHLLEDAGYIADSQGPQRVYTLATGLSVFDEISDDELVRNIDTGVIFRLIDE